MEPAVSHLHTYFLFPFSIDREAVLEHHGGIWKNRRWIEGLDDWLKAHEGSNEIARRLGSWKRAAHQRFDADSRAYQDMVFFHPFVRRIYFDTGTVGRIPGEQESLLRKYEIGVPADARLTLYAEDSRGRSAAVDVTSLKLYLFANGIGILAIGVESVGIRARDALWINEMMRKIYPSSGRQRREGRVPNMTRLTLEHEGETQLLVEETFQTCQIRAFQPPLSALVTSLLFFLDYPMQEYEPVLDERMIVYSYMTINPKSVPANWNGSDEHLQFVSRALYIDQWAEGYRYNPSFIREEMQKQLYWRWAHQGTFYGFTSYSSLTLAFGESDCDDHQLLEGFLIHRMFDSRYFLMTIIALFYRATLLDFAERVALVSRRLHRDFEDERLAPSTLRLTDALRSEFLNFSNYWHFDELANKDEESQHFNMQSEALHIIPMLRHTEREIERMHTVLTQYYQARSTQAVNRLAMLSMILGAGAVLTGFFGMNFGGEFAKAFFEPDAPKSWMHWVAIGGVTAFALGTLIFGIVLVVANWADYKDVLIPRSGDGGRMDSIKKIEDI